MLELYTEKQFLIWRALQTFNNAYGTKIKIEDCSIVSINPGLHSDRGYEITTPNGSEYLIIHYYFSFTRGDRSIPPRLEVKPPYIDGQLGDEVFVIYEGMDIWYRESGTYKFDWIIDNTIPRNIIMTESNFPILTEDGFYLLLENSV